MGSLRGNWEGRRVNEKIIKGNEKEFEKELTQPQYISTSLSVKYGNDLKGFTAIRMGPM